MRSNDSQKVIVVGVPKTLDDAQLGELFGDFGAVAEAKVVLDAAGASRGFGFVTFTAASAMRAAIKAMNRRELQGRTLNVRQLVPKDQFQAQQQKAPDAAQRPCWLLRKGKCTKGAGCPFSHEIKDGDFGNCFEFVQTGECKRGDKCKFSHPRREQEEEQQQKQQEPQQKQPEKRVCYSFQNGRCHRGKKCLYAHELLAAEQAANKQVAGDTEVGKKRRRTSDDERVNEKLPAAAGLAAHVNHFMATQTQQKEDKQQKIEDNKQKKPIQKQQKQKPVKFEWKAKTQTGSQHQEQELKQQPKQQPKLKQESKQEQKQEQKREQKQEQYDQQVEIQRPVKKIKTEKIDMGAAFDGVSDDEAPPRRRGKKRKVDKETMRANREKLKQERRAKRNAKKTALSKLMTKGEVELA
ncbi:unnamed protein product [Phytophthora lilii]|uniref:Unnamed protein product n=1 Tax=Phytophthora lilii TaxID=2077276 RepID=A0A9W6XDJ6_9STRA|nr:unnamed protein product [Phytophthora lilii]